MCEGMYSKKSWGGLADPYILVKFLESKADGQNKPKDPRVSLAIFEWGDEALVGKAGNELNPFAVSHTNKTTFRFEADTLIIVLSEKTPAIRKQPRQTSVMRRISANFCFLKMLQRLGSITF